MKQLRKNDLFGVNGRPLSTPFWQSGDQPSAKLMCTFPGYSYPVEAPATFYQKVYFLESGYDWIGFDYRYNENGEYVSLADGEKRRYFREEQIKIGEYILDNFPVREIVLLGKSLGTRAIGEILKNTNMGALGDRLKIILLTPVDGAFDIVREIEKHGIRTLVVIGDKDPYYDRYAASELWASRFVRTGVIENAGHVFEEIGHDLEESILNLYKTIRFTDDFLAV